MPRFNYTGRKRIFRADAFVELENVGGVVGPKVKLSLSDYGFPEEAPIWLEFYTSTFLRRISFGTVGSQGFKGPKMIQGGPNASELNVRIKILDPSPASSRLIGVMKGCKPKYEEEEGEHRDESLLDLRAKKLDGEVWWLDFPQERESHPILWIDERLGDYRGVATTPWFQALVMPQVMREVLNKIIILNGFSEDEEDSVWGQWLQFARQFAPDEEEVPVADPKSDTWDADLQVTTAWIDQCVSGFARGTKFREAFALHVKGDEV